MSKELPTISPERAIRAFERLGYKVVRQRGSHARLIHPDGKNRKPLTIPRHHKDLGRGLLRKLCRDAGVMPQQLADLL
ncbi:MAG: type II toxin-antitoxin system HicA family toxin [Elusimicrobia bacterium]|nr:type II toxin-antitoxin system HicA family toxin [Elusimicrobiota bacterium]